MTEKNPFLPDDVCPALMTKALALNQVYLTCEFEERSASDVAIFYCLKTMLGWGPDDDDVSPESCRPGRNCHCGSDPT